MINKVAVSKRGNLEVAHIQLLGALHFPAVFRTTTDNIFYERAKFLLIFLQLVN